MPLLPQFKYPDPNPTPHNPIYPTQQIRFTREEHKFTNQNTVNTLKKKKKRHSPTLDQNNSDTPTDKVKKKKKTGANKFNKGKKTLTNT